MNSETAATRRALVQRVRAEFRQHYFLRCLEVAYRVIPCCNSCEYNLQGTCTAPLPTFSDNMPRSGLLIKDGEALCLQWSPAPAAIFTALQYAYKEALLSNPPAPKRIKAHYTPEDLETQARRFYAGEISAVDAAKALDIGLSTFYHKAKEVIQHDPN